MLSVDPPAAELIRRLAAERGSEPVVRVRVLGGGCSGLTWDVELGAAQRAGDLVRKNDGVMVVVDPVSAAHLRGARIQLGRITDNRLRTGLLDPAAGSAVVVAGVLGKHPCSCGESFAGG